MPNEPPSSRTRIRRIAERAHYDLEVVHRILDEAWHCHVAFRDESGVHCMPMACWREQDALFIHGSNGSRLMKTLAAGAESCVTVTQLDGLVLARSAFNHSMNYRCAILYGQFEIVEEPHKSATLEQFMRRIGAGREHEARSPSRNELNATQVLKLPLREAVAKIRTGGPKDDAEDMVLPVWAGVLPLRQQHLAPQRESDCSIEAPSYVKAWAG